MGKDINYCSVSIQYGAFCKKYKDNRCCVGCKYEHTCVNCCESSWFYIDCKCHHSVSENKSKNKEF